MKGLKIFRNSMLQKKISKEKKLIDLEIKSFFLMEKNLVLEF